MEQLARAWRRVAAIGKANHFARGFKQKRQRRAVFAPFEGGAGVALGLALGHRQVGGRVVALGFDHAHGDAVDKQHVVGRAGVGGVLAHRDAAGRAEVERFHALHHPAGLGELVVDFFTGAGFWRHAYLV